MTNKRVQSLAAVAGLALPMAAFVYLSSRPGLDRSVVAPVEHFYIVSVASTASLALAVLVAVASVRSRQPRTYFTSCAFLAIAGTFSVHGLTTPGVIVHHPYSVVVVSARLSLLAGGVLFALGAVEPPVRVREIIARHHTALMTGAIAAALLYIGANLAHHELLAFVPIDDDRLSYGAAAVAIGCFLFAAWQYYQAYAASRVLSAAAFSVGMILLAEAQVSMALGTVWRLSWWEYHVLMLVGFLLPSGALAMDYARGGKLAVIVEGLFLRDVLKKIKADLPDAVNALVAASEAKDPYLQGHARRVCQLSVRMGRHLGLSDAELRHVAVAALLHDVGKIGIPDAVLQKPGALDAEEFAVLKGHSTRGFHIVAQVPSLGEKVAHVIKSHHERLDGSGYPDGLKGDEISLEARIVAVADVWDALTSDRVYRRAWRPEAARDQLLRESGVKLDSRCVDALFKVLEEPGGMAEDPMFALHAYGQAA